MVWHTVYVLYIMPYWKKKVILFKVEFSELSEKKFSSVSLIVFQCGEILYVLFISTIVSDEVDVVLFTPPLCQLLGSSVLYFRLEQRRGVFSVFSLHLLTNTRSPNRPNAQRDILVLQPHMRTWFEKLDKIFQDNCTLIEKGMSTVEAMISKSVIGWNYGKRKGALFHHSEQEVLL